MDRRQFITSTTAASGLLLLDPRTVWTYQANSAVRLGLLGCGSRGTTVATSFAKNTNARVMALADLFPDQLEAAKTHFNELAISLNYDGISAKTMFRGHNAFEEIASCKDV